MSHTVTGESITAAQRSLNAANLDALVLTPGPQLQYLTGLDAAADARFTTLIVPPKGQTTLIVPRFARPETNFPVADDPGIRVVDYSEAQDPYGLTSRVIDTSLGRRGIRIGLSDETAVVHWHGLLAANPWLELNLASQVLAPLQSVKTPAELAELTQAADAIDVVHEQMGRWLVAGRTESQVAHDITAALSQQMRPIRVSVASGQGSANTRHKPTHRQVAHGDVVVVDIAAAMDSGYRGQCARTYVLSEMPLGFAAHYDAVREAYDAALATAGPGITASAIDAAAKQHLRRTGHNSHFTHSTGYGVGLSEHERPYLMAGDSTPLESGMVFTVGPGAFRPGRFGARIQDVVVCADTGVQRLNALPTSISILR